MKRIFLDTNFLIDYFIREDYNGDAEKVLKLGNSRKMEFYISYLTVANFAYILRKMPSSKLRELISKICDTFIVVSNTKQQIIQNLHYELKDFEDGLQYQAALAAECDCLITRNKKDFEASDIAIFTPLEFVESIQSI